MKRSPGTGPRALALCLAGALTASLALPAAAAEPIGDNVTPTYDEAYYATLDYYGNLTEGSVVKSYTLNGATALTDCGTYDQVVNLTDGTLPVTRNGVTEFRFDQAPSHFYFEGRTAEPFQNLPWTLSISYTLNGVAVRAEDLAGRTGVVEITVDAIPNENASDYARYNYTLEAMAMFNQDDILSLEAPGAQVQLIGNLRAVLFIALPGEEQHFVIRVGSEDFSFSGMTFLMVPATLSQLQEIAKLSQRKDELEEDYDALSGSLDTLLDSFTDLGSSLRDTASGLDELNRARNTISSGKDQIYQDGDRVLADLRRLNGSLNTLPGHLTGTGDAVDDVTGALSGVADAAVGLQGSLDDVNNSLRDLQRDIRDIRSGTGSMEDHLDQLGADLKSLQDSLQELEELLKALDIQISGGIISEIPENVRQHIKVQGQKLSDILTQVQALETVWASVAKDAEGNPAETITYPQFQIAALLASKSAASAAEAQVLLSQVQAVDSGIAQIQALMPGLTAEQALQHLVTAGSLTQDQAETYASAKPKLVLMKQVYAAVTGGADRPMDKAGFFTAMLMLNDINKLPADQQTPENISKILAKKALYAQTGKTLAQLNQDHDTTKLTGLLENLEKLLGDLGGGGLAGDLGSLVGKTDTTMGHLDGLADVGRDILDQVDDLLTEVRDLDDTINRHVPGLHDTLEDTRTLVEDMVVTVDDTTDFLTSFRQLARDSGSQLDQGTQQSLTGLAASLRKTAHSVDATGDVRSAKEKIDEIIEDTWTEYTGEVNNLLLMDAGAPAVSLTSEENPSPVSVQVLIRSQEIKAEDAVQEAPAGVQAESTTFWGRVTQMFRDFWSAITGIFR
ncbi:hypothetical protein [uncultured Oscillibacter sp.]|uniref:hypothetical protein n=1 Tax=uncultured Oscillibacter sp. TaxID=876091 RepID=UPI0026305FF5|nr:hypothetical protein [uncultured Oscillibacter sp.]